MSNLCLPALGPASSPATEAPCYCLAQWLPPAVTGTVSVQRPGHSVAVRRPGDFLPCCRLHLAGVLQVLVTIPTPSAACRAFDSMGFYLDVSRPSFHDVAFTVVSMRAEADSLLCAHRQSHGASGGHCLECLPVCGAPRWAAAQRRLGAAQVGFCRMLDETAGARAAICSA
jgi:hypothetical protein